MNQAIRERFYGCGNDRHVEYVIREGGMTEQEAQLLRLLIRFPSRRKVMFPRCMMKL